jgi:hypothetical protein
MKKLLTALAMVSALALLPACADEGYYGRSGGGVAAYGGGGLAYYDGYYDGFYGPLWSGYWGPDEVFYYSTARGQPFIRDDGQHFRREASAGFNHFHMRDMHGRG